MTKDPDWPLSGPIDETVDEATDRFSVAGETPAIQACFRRLSVRLEEMERRLDQLRSDDLTSVRDELLSLDAKWRAREDTLTKEMRDRDHSVRNDAAKASAEVADMVADLRSDLVDHELADAKVHTDIRGENGKNGKIGRLEERQAATDRRIKWAAGIVVSILLASAGGAFAALEKMNERAREAGREDERKRQLERRLDRVEGYLLGSGLINLTPGDEP